MADYTYGGLAPEYVQGVRDFEGFRDTGYGDYKQRSIGYGSKEERPGERIDRAEAERRLDRDLAIASGHVDRLGVEMTPGQRAALSSLTHNAGPGWQNAGLGDAVRAGDWNAAAQHFAQYNKAGGEVHDGLVGRRAKEGAWMSGGDGATLPPGATLTSGARDAMASGALSQGVQNVMRPDTRKNPDPALSSANLAGGPGVLSSIGNVLNGRQEDGTPGGFNFARALTGAGNALQSINDPKGAAASEANQLKSTADNFSIHFDPKSGKIIRLRKGDGNVTTVGGADTSFEAAKPELLKVVDDEAKAVAHTHNTAKQAQVYLDAIKNGTLDTSIFGQGQAAWDSAFGKGSKQAELYNGFDSWRTQMANDQLLLNKGVQTDKDYVRAKEGLLTGLAKNDKQSVINALENGISRMHEVGVKPFGNTIDSATRAAGSKVDPELFSAYKRQHTEANDWFTNRSTSSAATTNNTNSTPPAKRPPLASFNR